MIGYLSFPSPDPIFNDEPFEKPYNQMIQKMYEEQEWFQPFPGYDIFSLK
jgi:hypothetical protein